MTDNIETVPVVEKAVEHLTAINVTPFITLIVTDKQGCVLGSIAGQDGRGRALTMHLRDQAELDNPQVAKRTNTLTPSAQDTYEVDRSFVLETASHYASWDNAKQLMQLLPLECTCTFTFVVHY